MCLGWQGCGHRQQSLWELCYSPQSHSGSVNKLIYSEPLEVIAVFKLSDFFILLAVIVSFVVSDYLWFKGFRELGIFTAIWVPSILAFGIYFKLAVLAARREAS